MTAAELSEAIRTGEVNEIIRVAEARQVKRLSQIADSICSQPGVRLVLLAGGSSSGKTTTAKRLCTQIRVNLREAQLLSTDDYFVGDALNPRDENGELDYEHIDCVDRVRFAADMNALFRGETVVRRRFDFVRHEGYDSDEKMKLSKDGIIVVEGIHALNPLLSQGIDETSIFRIYIDPKPSLEIDDKTRPSGEDSRLLRRLIRDSNFRHMSPRETFAMWPKVLAGEARWILPYRGFADARFDSYLVYELAALRPFVGGLIARAIKDGCKAPDILRLQSVLQVVPDLLPTKIPGNSIIRETIGGSQLEY